MNASTSERLNAVNREFYASHASAFDASRNHPWPGWRRALGWANGKAIRGSLEVLDVGCGNGRFAAFLLDGTRNSPNDPLAVTYTGVDQSPELLSIASEGRADKETAGLKWIESDVLAGKPGSALPPGPFDLVVAFGLLHHVPGIDQRKQLVAALGERTGPGGHLIFTVWQFGRTKRFEGHVIPWEKYNAESEHPIATDELEDGDYLLSFGETANPPRYCHHCDDSEFADLVAATGLRLVDDFEADGRSGDLNRYAVLQRTP